MNSPIQFGYLIDVL